jgi:hypothetical protein
VLGRSLHSQLAPLIEEMTRLRHKGLFSIFIFDRYKVGYRDLS